jgi:hypothetical protein
MNANPLFMQVLASRMGGGDNPMISALLGMTGGGGAPGVGADDLLTRLVHSDDPRVREVVRNFREQRDANGSSAVVEDAPSRAARAATEATDPSLPRTSPIRDTESRAAASELETLRARLDDLAHALGACPTCWGGEAQCRNCRGRGQPGFAIPDRPLFTRLIVPGLRTMRAYEAIQRAATAEASRTPKRNQNPESEPASAGGKEHHHG